MSKSASPLTLVALASWLVTAMFGVNLFVRGKAYRLFLYCISGRARAKLRPPVIRATLMGLHLLCAVTGLVLWIAYAVYDRRALAYGALVLLCVVALLGIFVVDRWRNNYGRHVRPVEPARGFPVWSATLHVMVATTTLVLVVLVTVAHMGD